MLFSFFYFHFLWKYLFLRFYLFSYNLLFFFGFIKFFYFWKKFKKNTFNIYNNTICFPLFWNFFFFGKFGLYIIKIPLPFMYYFTSKIFDISSVFFLINFYIFNGFLLFFFFKIVKIFKLINCFFFFMQNLAKSSYNIYDVIKTKLFYFIDLFFIKTVFLFFRAIGYDFFMVRLKNYKFLFLDIGLNEFISFFIRPIVFLTIYKLRVKKMRLRTTRFFFIRFFSFYKNILYSILRKMQNIQKPNIYTGIGAYYRSQYLKRKRGKRVRIRF